MSTSEETKKNCTSQRRESLHHRWLGVALAFGIFTPVAFGSVPTQVREVFKNWAFSNNPKNDIGAQKAWGLQAGSKNIVVAIVDTGIDATHPDLRPNLWQDPLSGREIHGWNFVNDRPVSGDEHGHGTHIAGIIGAVRNPTAGVAGVAQKVSLMAIKYYSAMQSGEMSLVNSIKALNYAIDHGAKVINYSGGGDQFSEQEFLALKRAERKNILVVAAAGNKHNNTDLELNSYYPASYRLSNVISVAAVDRIGFLAPFSNWGTRTVDVAAPGEEIYSTLPRDQKMRPQYGPLTGTSQATAFVSGLAALILAEKPELSPGEIKSIIMRTADRLPTLKDKVITGGKINVYQALLEVRRSSNPLARPLMALLPYVPTTLSDRLTN